MTTLLRYEVQELTDIDLDHVAGGGFGGDIEALAFIVLMQSAKSSQDDIAQVMAETKAINNTKNMLRDQLSHH